MAEQQMSREEQMGYHKGAFFTLLKEKEGLMQMMAVVDQFIQAHMKALKELGIDIEAEMKKAAEIIKKAQQEKKPGESVADKLA